MLKHGKNIGKTAILQGSDSKIKNRKGFLIMKKLLSVILIIAAVLTVFGACSKTGKPVESGDYTYVVMEDNTAKITKYNGTEDIVTLDIPSSLDEYTVTVIGAEAFANVQTITVVNFPNTLVKVEEKAFAGSSIKKAFLHKCPELTEIAALAFSECHNLVQVDMAHNLMTVGDQAFYYCDKLKVANFRGNTENIAPLAFDACRNVKIYTKSNLDKVIDYAETYHIELKISEA